MLSLPPLVAAQFADQDGVVPSATPPGATAPITRQPALAPPPVNLVSGRQTPLGPQERRALRLANEWKGRTKGVQPGRGQHGTVLFAYGGALPTLVCAPLYICNLHLEPGEVINQLDVADTVRWKVTPSLYGSGANATTLLVIKPTDSGLETSMTVATNRRFYTLRLVSRTKDWMPNVAFSYPAETTAAWSAYYAALQRQRDAAGLVDGQNTANLDFGYRLKGEADWKPLRVYTDGVKTYVQFPPTAKNAELPALVAIGADDREQLVNYRLSGDKFVVDKVLKNAALISGVGSRQEKIDIVRDAEVN
jgi:type IV secretion system protein VirB9